MALTDNIAHYYKFDESSGNASDSVGSATLTNNSVTRGAGTGKINGGGTYNGSSSYFTNASSFTDTQTNTAYSLQYWVKTTTSSAQFIATHHDNTNAHAQWNLYINDGSATTPNIGFQVHPENSGTDTLYLAAPFASLTDGNWHHVVVTYDGSKAPSGVKIYADGTSQSITTILNNLTTTDAPTACPIFIGSRGAFGTYFNGSIDEFALWTRVLSSSEVTQLYNGGTGLQYPFNFSASLAAGSYSQTGNSITAAINYTTSLVSGVYSLVGYAIATALHGWQPQTKHSANWSNTSKHSSNWSNNTKHSSNWTNKTKH